MTRDQFASALAALIAGAELSVPVQDIFNELRQAFTALEGRMMMAEAKRSGECLIREEYEK